MGLNITQTTAMFYVAVSRFSCVKLHSPWHSGAENPRAHSSNEIVGLSKGLIVLNVLLGCERATSGGGCLSFKRGKAVLKAINDFYS